jgi:hypothetical protein
MKVTKRISEILVIRISTAVFLIASGAVTRNAAAQAVVWTQAPGSLLSISAGGDESIWGVNSGGSIYKWNRVTQDWVQSTGNAGVPGRIAVDPSGRPWVVKNTGEIFRKGDGNPSTDNWQLMPGKARDLAIGGNGSVWASIDGWLSKWDPNQSTWIRQALGQATDHVAVDSNGWPYVVAGNQIWCVPADSAYYAYMFALPGQLPAAGVSDISFSMTGSNTDALLGLLIIGGDGKVYSYNNASQRWDPIWTKSWAVTVAATPDTGAWISDGQKIWTSTPRPGWTQLTGLLSNISVGADGSVWGINSQGVIYKWSPAIADWVQSTGSNARVIAVAPDGRPWLVNSAGQIWRKPDGDPSNGGWQQMPGQAARIAIGGDGSVWISNAAGSVFKWDGISNWIQAPASGVTRIAVTPQGVPWVINSSSQVWAKLDGDPKNGFIPMPGAASDISVGPDGVVWITGYGGAKIWRYNGGGWDLVREGSFNSLAGDRNGVWLIDTSNQIWKGTGLVLHPASWMTDAAPFLGNRPLNKLILPATHDSGTFGLINTVDRLLQAPDDIVAPDSSEFKALASVINITDDWAKAQDQDIYHQLSDGIRSIDLRPCIEKAGNIRVCHGLYGPLMSDLLNDVRRFADEHPQEIILLQFSGFHAWPSNDMSASQHAQLRQMIHDKLGDHLLTESQLSAWGGSTILPAIVATTPLNTIWLWNKYRNGNILVVYKESDPINNPEFWTNLPDTGASPIPPGEYYNSYISTWDEGTKKQSLLDNLFAPADTNRRDQEMVVLNDLSTQSTPDNNAIEASLFHGYPGSIRDMADATNPVTLGWIKNEWAAQSVLNIVTADFYDRTCLVALTYVLNGLATDLPSGCQIGGNTSWSGWSAAKACPAEWTDTLFTCWKPSSQITYDRGVGYPWKFGDPLDSSGMFSRCEADNGTGTCEQCLAIVYPKCKGGYHAVGSGACTICSLNCPSNMTDTGVACQK